MSGFFGVISKSDCVSDLFYGTDYHSHLGTIRGGMAVRNPGGITRFIHDITNSQFRSKFSGDITRMQGNSGIGVISDLEDQPLIIGSHLGTYAIITVGAITNAEQLVKEAFGRKSAHFSEMSGGEINPTEVIAMLINREATFLDGIRHVQNVIEGSCSLLLLTGEGIYASRDRMGRTPVITGRKPGACAATLETCAFPNLDFEVDSYLGPGEIVLLTPDSIEQLNPPGDRMKICSFLWVYYGYPASCYEGINVEEVRNRCGAALARNDDISVDLIAGVPDSGTAHAIGYANEASVPYRRPFVKYTPTWPRSFMPQNQETRDTVARMKLIPIQELINGKKMLLCEDSIVRGTQLKDTIRRLYDCGAVEVHMRPACPALAYGCKYLNFSRSRSILDLAARQAVREIEGDAFEIDTGYTDQNSEKYREMVDRIRARLQLTSLRYQKLSDMIEAIGLPAEKLCTYCWDGRE